ncbi:EamA domain-containing membrane protein RarD [Desulfuromusa kysingii]|uniref:EamA domain-containing membrane protein RarD n=1 Tax=Desulfuromusa kysingii TaxID=37625 RepID=A0A1H4C9Z7_9BACT|nr:DMT family transporter [Desulfuromusa kysingii]SEA56922.1 EamA domain-containing membrane protein RarD [Desulfuromusa kysingii]
MTHTIQTPLPLLKLLLGSVCISFSPIFIKIAAVPPDSAGFYRMTFASISLTILMFFLGENLKMALRPRLLLALGGVFLAIDFMAWHRSIALVGPGLSTLLGNFQVFFTALFSWLFLKQKISKMFILAIIMALCGLLFITGVDWNNLAEGYKLGIFLGLVTAIFYSFYILLVKASMDDCSVNSVPAMLMVAIPGALVLGVVTPLNGATFVIPSGSSLFALIGVGVISTTIGWSLISSAIQRIPATVAGLILLLQPTLALIWDTLLFDRPTQGIEVFGILLILSAIYIGSYRR